MAGGVRRGRSGFVSDVDCCCCCWGGACAYILGYITSRMVVVVVGRWLLF